MHVASRTEMQEIGRSLSGKAATSRFLVAEKTEKGEEKGARAEVGLSTEDGAARAFQKGGAARDI